MWAKEILSNTGMATTCDSPGLPMRKSPPCTRASAIALDKRSTGYVGQTEQAVRSIQMKFAAAELSLTPW